jgi:uncharacterized membrane protein
MIREPFQLFIVLVGVVLISVYLDKKYEFARKVSPVLLILFIAAIVSNVGIIQTDSPFYNLLTGFTVPFAVCLVLFRVRLEDFKATGVPLLVAFTIASIGTITGTLTAGVVMDPLLKGALGADSWKLAGPYCGTYIGGSLNFFAVWDGLKIGRPDLFAAANAVDNLIIFPLFAIWIFVPSLLGRFYPVAKFWHQPTGDAAKKPETREPRLKVFDVIMLSFLALVIMLVSDYLNTSFLSKVIPEMPTILIITTLALILAQFRFVANLEGAMEMSNISFYIFFAAVGAMMNFYQAVILSPILFVYVMIIVVFHMLIIYGIGRLFRLDIKVLTIASVSTKAGPPTVVALANVKGWHGLTLPGVAAGILGYAIGNYAGFGTAYALKAMLGL